MFTCGTQRNRTSMKPTLWALKPNATEYSFVDKSNKDTDEVSKQLYLSIYPGCTFKVSKRIPQVK